MRVMSNVKTLSILIACSAAMSLAGCRDEKVISVPEDSAQAKLSWAVVDQSDKAIVLGAAGDADNGKKTYKEKMQLKKVCISGVVYLIVENYVYTSIGNEVIYNVTPFLEANKEKGIAQPALCETQ